MDLEMPIMNGYEAAHRIKVMQPSCRVITLTIHADQAEQQKAFPAGADDFIVKGAPLETLMNDLTSSEGVLDTASLADRWTRMWNGDLPAAAVVAPDCTTYFGRKPVTPRPESVRGPAELSVEHIAHMIRRHQFDRPRAEQPLSVQHAAIQQHLPKARIIASGGKNATHIAARAEMDLGRGDFGDAGFFGDRGMVSDSKQRPATPVILEICVR